MGGQDDGAAWLRDIFRHAVVEHDGVVVGFAYVSAVRNGGTRREVVTLGVDGHGAPMAEEHVWGDGTDWLEGRREPRVAHGELPGLLATVDHAEGDLLSRSSLLVSAANQSDPRGIWTAGTLFGDRMTAARSAVLPGFAEAAERYLTRLDPQALAIVRRYPQHRERLVLAWDSISASAGDAPLGTALRAHPGLPGTVLAAWKASDRGGFARTVHEGRLDDLLAAALVRDGLPATSLRAVGKAERALSGRVGDGARTSVPSWLRRVAQGEPERVDLIVELARVIADFPPDWIPATTRQWEDFAVVARVALKVREAWGRNVQFQAALPSGGDWTGLLARLAREAGVPSTDGGDALALAMEGFSDMAAAYARQVLMPAVAAAGRDPGLLTGGEELHQALARAVLCGGRTLARVLGMSADWHRRQARMEADMAALPGAYAGEGSWPAGFADATVDGVDVVVLPDAASLVAEGARGRDDDGIEGLDNCVGGYAVHCRSGHCRVLSLRRRLPDSSFERLSVAEVTLGDGRGFPVAQHVGRRNGPVPGWLDAVLDAYLEPYRSGRAVVDRRAFDPIPVSDGEFMASRLGFDPAFEGTRVAVARMWDRYVPRPLHGLDADTVDLLMPLSRECLWPETSLAESVSDDPRSPGMTVP